MSARFIYAVAALLVAALGSSASCARRISARVPAPARAGDVETGIASWYGAPYDGRRAASGEIYDMTQLTAAHRALPFGTWVEVTDLDNGKRVEVRITDRGPFIDGRIIDLSQAAARQIEMLGPGIARVRLKVISPPARAEEISPPQRSITQESSPRQESSVRQESAAKQESFARQESFAVQAGAFSDHDRAESFRTSLAGRFADDLDEGFSEARVVETSTVWRVILGRQMTLDAANRLASKVRGALGEALVVLDRYPYPH